MKRLEAARLQAEKFRKHSCGSNPQLHWQNATLVSQLNGDSTLIAVPFGTLDSQAQPLETAELQKTRWRGTCGYLGLTSSVVEFSATKLFNSSMSRKPSLLISA